MRRSVATFDVFHFSAALSKQRQTDNKRREDRENNNTNDTNSNRISQTKTNKHFCACFRVCIYVRRNFERERRDPFPGKHGVTARGRKRSVVVCGRKETEDPGCGGVCACFFLGNKQLFRNVQCMYTWNYFLSRE